MISGLIPHRYARALFKFAGDTGKQKEVYAEMNNVIEAFRTNPGLEKILANPFVDSDDKRKVLLAAAGEKPGNDYQRFVKLILDHKREEFALLMALAYRDIYRKENKISRVVITTATELPETEMNKLKSVVQKAFKDRSFEWHTSVDPYIIGGFVIDVDTTRMDASISNELKQLRQNLAN